MSRADFNNLSPAQAECLALLAEECAEVIQVVGKILRHGLHSYHPDKPKGPSNASKLCQELGDVRAATWLCHEYGVTNERALGDGAFSKIRKVGKFLHHADAKRCF